MANEKRLTLSTDETCGDCVHAKVCKEVNGSWFSPKNIAFCRLFKNKADFVEVVRCKDCKHLEYGYQCYYPLGMMLNNDGDAYVLVDPDEDFCSCGERRDGE